MNSATDVVAAARSEIGYTESPPGSNCNKFAIEAHLKNCTYWCAAGTSAILIREHADVPPGVLTLSTRSNLAAWKKAGMWVPVGGIRAGDIPFFHLTGRNGPWPTPDHTGIATGPLVDGHLPTVEFNTSADDHGSQDNGGGVFPKNRPAAIIIGAGRPDYGSTTPSPPDEEDDMRLPVYFCRDHGNETSGPFFLSNGFDQLRNITKDNAVDGFNLGQYGKPQSAPHRFLENISNNGGAANIPGSF